MSTCDTEIVGNDIVNEDGEVIGVVGWKDFVIHDEADARRVLKEIQREEARLVAVKAEYDATLANVEAALKLQSGRLEWFRRQFTGQIHAYAQQALARTKRRTLIYPEGRVELRTQPARMRLLDKAKEAALAWARNNFPAAIRRKEVEDVPFEGIQKFIADNGVTPERMYDETSPQAIRDLATVVEFVAESETVTIKTGVGK